MSEDHKPNRPDERQRIESAGGVVVWAGTWRVGGVLAVSRAFGDRMLKKYVVAIPDIKEETLVSHDEFIIMASDGLWDVIENQEAVDFVRDVKVSSTHRWVCTLLQTKVFGSYDAVKFQLLTVNCLMITK